MVAVLPQAGILCIQEPKGLNFKEGEKQKNDICKISGTSTVHFRLLCSHRPIQPSTYCSPFKAGQREGGTPLRALLEGPPGNLGPEDPGYPFFQRRERGAVQGG